MAYILEKIGNTYNLPKKYFTCDAKSDLDGISLVDVPIGSEAYCILEEESYILDSNKQWHKKKIGEDLTGQVQSDLSQTDSTKPDYVKGVLRNDHLPEGYPYKSEGLILDGTFEFADGGGIYMHQIADENFTYADGKSYTIIWDGEAYQCVATTFEDMFVVFGNLAIAGDGADTGEPFLFIISDTDKVVYTTDTAATHTITVRGETVYPMASEFLPLDSTPTTDSTNPVTSGGVKNALDGKVSLAVINARMPDIGDWRSVTYGNGKFVAVAGYSTQAAYSEDGINWTQSTMPSSSYWNSVTYGSGKFVAVAYIPDKEGYSEDDNKAAYSEDGITWKTAFEYLSQNNSNITESVRSAIGIPSYSTANNGQFLRVIDGIPTWTESLPTLTSPNGTKYKLTVSDDGTLSAVAVS